MGPAIDFTSEEAQIMNTVVEVFRQYNASGIGALQDVAMYICFLLAIIEFASDWSLYEGGLRLSKVINDIIKTAFFFFIIGMWPRFVYWTEDFFVNIGLIAGGVGNGVALNPSDILDKGLSICSDMFGQLTKSMASAAKAGYDTASQGITSDFNAWKDKYTKEHGEPPSGEEITAWQREHAIVTDNAKKAVDTMVKKLSPMQILVYLIAIFMVLFAHFWIALQLMVTQVEYYIFTALATIFLPFGVCRHTKFLFDKSVQGLVNFGVKMMGLFFLLAVCQKGLNLMEQTNIPADKAFDYYLRVGLVYIAIAFIVWKLPDRLSSLMSGSSTMGAGDVTSGTRMATATVAGVAGGAIGFTAGRAHTLSSSIKDARASGGGLGRVVGGSMMNFASRTSKQAFSHMPGVSSWIRGAENAKRDEAQTQSFLDGQYGQTPRDY